MTGEVYSRRRRPRGPRLHRRHPRLLRRRPHAEDVRDNFDKIRDEDGYEVPANLNEEMMLAFKAMS